MTNSCEYFGWCGGCTSQAPDTVGYRNRMDFTVFFGGIGLRRKGRYDFVEKIRQCAIALPPINILLAELWTWFEANKDKIEPFHLRKLIGTLRYSIIRCTAFSDDTAIIFVLNQASLRLKEHLELIKNFAAISTAKHILIGQLPPNNGASVPESADIVKGSGILTEHFLGKPVQYHALGFAQANPHGFQELLGYVKTMLSAHSRKYTHLIDLYGGAGTFGFSLSDLFTGVVIIDQEGNNIRCAEQNAKNNNYFNVKVVCADAKEIINIPNLPESCLILDPPRAGIHPKTLKNILGLHAPVIIYVSCNPKQLEKELPEFSAAYELKSLKKFGLFPNTSHYETVAELVCKTVQD